MIPITNYEIARNALRNHPFGEFLEQADKTLETDFEYASLYKLMAETLGDSGSPTFLSNLNMFFHLLHMVRGGDKIYNITPGLATRLAQTEVNVDSYFIKSPFREIFIQIDPGLFYIKDPYGKTVPVTGFYTYLKEYPDFKQLRILATGISKNPENHEFVALFYIKIELTPGKVKDQIKKYLAEKAMDVENMIRFGGNLNIDYWEEFVNFVLNILLYITCKNPDFTNYAPCDITKKLAGLKNPAKKRKFEQKMLRTSQCPITIVGAGILDQNNDLQAIQAAGGVGSWKLTKRVKVSGHWRAQRYGTTDNTRYETIWINDYEKGPELADLLKNPYMVKESK